MLKLHDFYCETCKHNQEELLDIPPELASIQCKKCGALMTYVVVGGKAYTFKPFIHPHLGNKPIEIKSWKHYKQELKKCGGANELAS